jgi:hypothetical protein
VPPVFPVGIGLFLKISRSPLLSQKEEAAQIVARASGLCLTHKEGLFLDQQLLRVGDAPEDEVRMDRRCLERLFIGDAGQDKACGNP